jgi:methionine salvage enolase-phosphatase E1
MTLHSVAINGVYQSAEVVHAVMYLQDQITELKAAAKQAIDAMTPVAAYGRPGSRDVEQAALQNAIKALKACK